jgi:hypothetical protein
MAGQWLKKYTEIKYLNSILAKRHLYMADPCAWPDKNDSTLVEVYSKAVSATKTRITCLTEAPDRFHFWTVFGGERNGVCLWFDREALLADVNADDSVRGQSVRYLRPKELSKVSVAELPFSKRSQYEDESEFRIIRSQDDQCRVESDTFEFSANSLKRVYFNSWLNSAELVREKEKIQPLLELEFSHVKLLQSRMLNMRRWILAARSVAHQPGSH